MSGNLNEITLDLDKSCDVSAITQGAIIHVEARNRFPKLIGEVLKRGEEIANLLKREGEYKVFYSRMHEVIMLSGRRGAGKTTMLLHLLEEIEKCSFGMLNEEELNYGENNSQVYKIYDQLYPLGIFDPTLLGGREHLLSAILVRICGAVENFRQKRRLSAEYSYGNTGMRDFDTWRESLRNMANGLKVLGESEGNRNPSSIWEDPQFVLDESLKRAQHGEDLERNFQRFVDNSLKILGKKSFIIGLDDIDTQPGVGMHVLEVLRKYLTTPQLITILSGDIELYSSIIRKGQLDAFGIPFNSKDEVLDRNERMISGLVDQYMNKLLPSRNRIHISYVNKCIEDKKIYIRLQKEDEPGKQLKYELIYFTEELIKKIFSTKSQEDIQAIKNVIFDNPARTVMQLLIVAAENIDTKNSKDTAGNGEICFKKGVDFSSHLADIFYESLHRFGYTYADFENLATLKGMGRFLDCLARKNLFGDAPSLQLRNDATWINEAMLVIQAGLTRTFARRPALALVYALHVCLPQEVLPREDYQNYLKAVRLKKHSQGIWDLAELTPNVMPYLHAKTSSSSSSSSEEKYFLGTIDIRQSKIQGDPDYKLYLILALSLENILKEGVIRSYISIYTIISFFTYALSLDEEQMKDKTLKRRVVDFIGENILPIQYSDKNIATTLEVDLYKKIVNIITSWKKLFNNFNVDYDFSYSPLFISKFMQRFIKKMQILDNYADKIKMKKEIYFTNAIVCFLNSLYIEECEIRDLKEDGEPFSLDDSGNITVQAGSDFTKNLEQAKLLLLFMTFPLLRFFINNSLYNSIKNYIEDVVTINNDIGDVEAYIEFTEEIKKFEGDYPSNVFILFTDTKNEEKDTTDLKGTITKK